MTTEPDGRIVTFYSFKGGTGRTMALANVAWILAANGKRVLMVDWDLESPGLHRYFSPFLGRDAIERRRTVIGLVQDFQDYMGDRDPDDASTPEYAEHADLSDRVVTLEWDRFPGAGRLDLLPAGRLNRDYATVLSGLKWDDFYERHAGGPFLDAVRAEMRQRYDYVLIDSRTGYSDVADICTVHMPDTLVLCFTLNEQGIEGSSAVARQVEDHARHIRIMPVPMRLDAAEKEKSEAIRAFAKERFEGLPEAEDRESRDRYWNTVFVPYQAYYNYEERLATIGDPAGVQGTLLAAYEKLTSELTFGEVSALPPLEADLRSRVNEQFERRLTVAERSIVLRYSPADRIWAEWLTDVLNRAGIRVADPRADPAVDASGHRNLLIVSDRSEADPDLRLSELSQLRLTALAVCVSDSARSWLLADRRATFLTALDEQGAIHAVLRLVGRSEALGSQPRSGTVRYPFDEPAASNLDLRLQTFTGRESDLLAVRHRLLAGGKGQPSMVALQGMGGVGKSQIALEYAHRFRNAYDVVWSVKADPVTFIDTQLSELGHQLGLPLSETRATVENTRTVLEALSRNPLYRRWLLIFDNAEDPERVLPFMPKGSGHILVTSRKPAWRVTAGPESYLEVDVFPRVESIQHLRARAPKVSATEANEVAGLVGDLPLAVNAAGAFLSETSYSVERFLDAVRTGGPNALPLPSDESVSEELRERPVQAVWEVSLNELEQRSTAAYRLLQFCSVMDPSVALDLVYSDELNEDLVAIDPKLSESMVRGRLIRELSRLALARTDGQAGARTGGRLTVHRLIQDMVRYRMTDPERSEIRHQVHLALARFRPGGDVDNPQNWPVFRMIWPHLQASGAVGCPDDRVRSLLIDRVRYLWLVGDFRRGLRQAEETESVWKKRLAEIPDESEERHALRRQLLHLQFNKANLIRSLGDFTGSRKVDEEVLRDQRELLGDDHPHTLSTAGGLGGDLRGLGHYSDALELDQQTYELWREAFGEGHPRTLTSLGNLATCWRLMGDYKRAQALDEQVVRGRQEILGDRHPSTLQSMASVGRDLREAGEYQRSVYQLRIVAQALADEFGPESWETLNANVNLAISMRSAGRVEEARRLLDTAYGHMSESFRTAPNTLACRLSRAVTLLGASDEQAHAELRLVREDYRKRLGDDHPHTLVCVNDLAMAALTAGTAEAAESALELAEGAAGRFAAILGADHPYVLAAETNLAVCLAATGKDAEALAMLRSTVQRALTRLGETHPDTLSCQANIAILAERSGVPRLDDEADPGTIARRFSDRFGTDHPAVQDIERKRLIRRVIDPIPF